MVHDDDPLYERSESVKLLNVRIEGYKNIESVSIDLSDGFAALVSPNGYGKSNLLDAIGFAMDFIKADPVEKSVLMSRPYCIPVNQAFQGKDFLSEFTCSIKSDGKTYSFIYGFVFSWAVGIGTGEITKEWLQVREEEKAKRYNKMIDRDAAALYRSSPTGRCSIPIDVGGNELVINKLIAETNIFYRDIITALNQISMYSNRHAMNQEQLPKRLFDLKNRDNRRYVLIEKSLSLLIKDISGIDVQVIDMAKAHGIMSSNDSHPMENRCYSLYINKKSLNQAIDYRLLSDGEGAVLQLITDIFDAADQGAVLFAVDEIEKSIHPEIVSGYLSLLDQITHDMFGCGLIVTTQSPVILQNLKPDSIYIALPSERSAGDFRRIDAKKVKRFRSDADDFDETTGVYIMHLLSGDDECLKILDSYLEKNGEK